MKNRINAFAGIVVCMAILLTSCQKELAAITRDGDPPQDDSTSALFDNPFGVFMIGSASDEMPANTSDPSKQYELSYANKMLLAKDYRVKYIRQLIYEDKWNDDFFRKGFLLNFYAATTNGFKVLLNVMAHPITSNPDPFPDAEAYSSLLRDILDTLNAYQMKPELIVVENEEANSLYHVIDQTSQESIYADMQKYVDELTAAVSVCKNFTWWDGQQGVKITNGGLTTRAIIYDTWYWLYYTKKDTAAAREYAVNSLTPSTYYNMYSSLQNTGAIPDYIMSSVNTYKFLREKYELLDLSYINIHWYEPAKARGWDDAVEGATPWSMGISPDSTSKNVLETSIAYLADLYTPKVVSNEVGQITTSANVTHEMCNKITKHLSGSFTYATWMDADGSSVYEKKALHNTFMNSGIDSYTLRQSGTLFKQANAAAN